MGLLRFAPRLVEKVWGGRRLESAFGRQLPPDSPIGESWEISGLRDALTYVGSGPLKGADLYRLAASHGEEIFGPGAADECTRDFPLLVKFIDASDVLSVQVHPGDDYARKKGFAYGKSEAWFIVDADPGACVYRGFAPGVGPDELRAALSSGAVEDVEKCLNRIEVKAGDVIDLPAGVVHAIGAGLLLCEIQQSSDITYRVYDWGRLGLDGKPRALHLDEAFDVMEFGESGPSTATGTPIEDNGCTRVQYRDSYPFHLETLTATTLTGLCPPDDLFEVMCVVSGSMVLNAPDGSAAELKAGDSALIPASWNLYSIVPHDSVTCVRAWIVGSGRTPPSDRVEF